MSNRRGATGVRLGDPSREPIRLSTVADSRACDHCGDAGVAVVLPLPFHYHADEYRIDGALCSLCVARLAGFLVAGVE